MENTESELRKAELELKESEERFKVIVEYAPMPITAVRISDGIMLYANEAYKRVFGYEGEELTGKKAVDLYPCPDDRNTVMDIINKQGFLKDYEMKLKKKDGAVFWTSGSAYIVKYGGEQALLGSFLDISARRKAEEELKHLNRMLRALGDSAKAMLHADDEAAYMDEVCRIIINDCGYKMVWIGYAEDDEAKTVRPVTYCGFEEGYIETLNITWADTERGRGPTGTAIRTGKTTICNNMLTDPAFAPWRNEAVKRGYASSIVVPLIDSGKAFGALTIYSTEPDSFSKEEAQMIEELATDLSFGIISIRIRSKSMEVQNEIKRVASFPELNPNPICEIDFDGKILYSNHSFEQIFPDAFDKSFGHPLFAGLPSVIKTLKSNKNKFLRREVQVGESYYMQTIVHIADSWSLRFYCIDITSRKKVENEIRVLYQGLEGKVKERTLDLMRVNKKLSREIRTRREIEKKTVSSNAILKLLGQAGSRKEYMEELNKLIAGLCGCECTGIRMLDTKGNIPYEAYKGFSRDFWESENWLVEGSDSCICTRIISGKPEPQDRPAMTQAGSFCCGDIKKFRDKLTKKQAAKLRGQCIRSGYKSLAVIPIKYGNKIIGAIHMADKRKNIITKEFVDFMESLTPLIGEGIHKFNLTDSMRQTNELLEKIFLGGNFSIAYMDTNFNFIKVNDTYARDDKHTQDFFPGRNYFDLYPDEENKAMFKKVVEKGVPYFAFTKSFKYAKNPERGEAFYDWSLQPVKDPAGKTEGLVLVLVDVSERKKAEEELVKMQKELADSKHLAEIGTLASTVAHELRNPLGVINVAVYNIRKKSSNPDLDKHMANIEKKVMESNQIINNLLLYAKMKMPLYKKINIYDLMEECVDNVRKRFDKFNVIIVKKYKQMKNKFISADPIQMKEVYTNILNNAFQAVEHKKGRVKIEADFKPKGFVSVCIKDNGVGIEKENLDNIFQPFYTSKSKGTGLGLPICKELVGLHNGKIEVESAPGKGSTFIVSIPIKRAE